MNTSKLEGAFDEAKGKIKQAVGDTFNDQSMANSGAADEVKGKTEQTWGSVKDTAHDLGSEEKTSGEARTAEAGHSFRESVTNAADHAKASIERGLGNLKRDTDR